MAVTRLRPLFTPNTFQKWLHRVGDMIPMNPAGRGSNQVDPVDITKLEIWPVIRTRDSAIGYSQELPSGDRVIVKSNPLPGGRVITDLVVTLEGRVIIQTLPATDMGEIIYNPVSFVGYPNGIAMQWFGPNTNRYESIALYPELYGKIQPFTTPPADETAASPLGSEPTKSTKKKGK